MAIAPVPLSPARGRSPWLPGAVLAIAALLAYANTWQAPFVYDDILAIPENPTIRDLRAIGEILLPSGGGGRTFDGRPVLNLSLALNYAISGAKPWSYHVFNFLVHVGAGLALFGLARRTFSQLPGRLRRDADPLALALAATWLLHPLHTQAVTYTVQRAESLMGCFYLLTLYAFARGAGGTPDASGAALANSTAPRWFAVSMLACALGMATKEVMVTAPAMVLLYDRTFFAGSFRAALAQRWRVHTGLFGTWLLLVGLLATTGFNRGGTIGFGIDMSRWAYPATQFQALVTYLIRSVWPEPLVFEYGTFWVEEAGDILPYAAVIIPLVAATGVALWRWPALGFPGAWFFGIHAPTSLPQGTLQMIVEHRVYLSLAAVVALLVVAVHRAAGRRGLLAVGVLAVGFGILTARRNQDYRSNLALWSDTVAKRPANPRAREGLAEALEAAGRLEEAAAQRRESVRLQPREARYHHNLGVTLADAGKTTEAIDAYRRALALDPKGASTHNNLALLLAREAGLAAAAPHYEAAIRLQPVNPRFHYNYGTALLHEGRTAAAVKHFETALHGDQTFADAHFNLGTSLVRLGRPADALPHFAAAARLAPEQPQHGTTHGEALLRAGRAAEAAQAYHNTLDKHPDNIDALVGRASALAAQRRFAEAVRDYERALARAPDHAPAHFKLGNTLLDVDRVADSIPHYEAAIRLSPGDAETHHNLGIAFARLERWDDAQRAFEEALRLKPDYAGARRSLEQLRQITGR